ncbi:hypothetical protein ALI144C_08130 [Actinosynnema sp. ALI-1.44]|uniref:sensor histidine kinase n=1 Tax=Actinosynnema sp. ALI-1.44 TaxID=1933779 RepID=UPI00097BF4C9|nr:ATP-binding protein [Actinosynnema sp. ALI-1.44]ONI87894.1 hypothetical protein ALI144C_08130 [Actinosynnema sp. ALI-1.44]
MSVVNWLAAIEESLDHPDHSQCRRPKCAARGALVRLRRDLHDQTGTTLVGVGMGVEAAQRLIDTDLDEARRLLEDVRSEIALLVKQIRGIASSRDESDQVEPPDVGSRIGPAVRTMVSRMNRVVGDRVRITAKVDAAVDRLHPLDRGVAAAVFWIVREALTNVLKHSNASCCTVIVTVRSGELCALVEDDGVGFPAQRVSRGSGLMNMVERAREHGGRCRVGPRVPSGFAVNAAIPLTASARLSA